MKKFLLYTEDEGGDFRFISKHSDEDTQKWYKEIIETGVLQYRTGDRAIKIKPAYVAICSFDEGFDFIINKYRPESEASKEDKPRKK